MKYQTCWPVWLISSSQLIFSCADIIRDAMYISKYGHLVLEIKLINDNHHVA